MEVDLDNLLEGKKYKVTFIANRLSGGFTATFLGWNKEEESLWDNGVTLGIGSSMVYIEAV